MVVRFGVQIAALVLALPFAAGAVADESGQIRTDLFPGLFEKLENDVELQALWGSCPADIYRREAAFWASYIDNPDVKVEQCETDPAGCHAKCIQARNENACFSLGRALQSNLEEEYSRHWEALFARACATGSAGGCTNRGAGIRNGRYPDDPFMAKPEDVRDACLFRTFETSCSADDAWGCAMHGQSYLLGEGVAEDPVKAAEFFQKSCEIAPEFAACDYAKVQLQEIDSAPLAEQWLKRLMSVFSPE